MKDAAPPAAVSATDEDVLQLLQVRLLPWAGLASLSWPAWPACNGLQWHACAARELSLPDPAEFESETVGWCLRCAESLCSCRKGSGTARLSWPARCLRLAAPSTEVRSPHGASGTVQAWLRGALGTAQAWLSI